MSTKSEGISEKKDCQTDRFRLGSVPAEGHSGYGRPESVKSPPESGIPDRKVQLRLMLAQKIIKQL